MRRGSPVLRLLLVSVCPLGRRRFDGAGERVLSDPEQKKEHDEGTDLSRQDGSALTL